MVAPVAAALIRGGLGLVSRGAASQVLGGGLRIAAHQLILSSLTDGPAARQALQDAAGGLVVNVEALGSREVVEALKRQSKKTQKATIRRALRVGAKTIADRARELAPVESGDLRASVKVRAMKRSRRYIGAQVIIGMGLEGGRATFTEFGTRRLRASRFTRRAVEERRDQVLSMVSAQILRELGTLG